MVRSLDTASFCDESPQLNKLVTPFSMQPNIVRVVKSRRMRWAGHVARKGEGRGVHRVLVGKTEGKAIGETQT